MSTVNFGSIGGRRAVTFKVTEDGKVVPAKYRGLSDEEQCYLGVTLIPARESFRRWKIARKAWRTRKWKNQLVLKL